MQRTNRNIFAAGMWENKLYLRSQDHLVLREDKKGQNGLTSKNTFSFETSLKQVEDPLLLAARKTSAH